MKILGKVTLELCLLLWAFLGVELIPVKLENIKHAGQFNKSHGFGNFLDSNRICRSRGSFSLNFLQIRASRLIAAAGFLLKLAESFCSDDTLEKRRKIIHVLKHDPKNFKKMDLYREVFDFFEDVGLLLRKRVIPKEFIWSDYSYWILYYWTAFQGYIYWLRQSESDPTFYCEFEFLFKQIHAYEERKLNRRVDITAQKLEEFMNDEMKLGRN